MTKFKDSKGFNILKGLGRLAITNLVPGGNILANLEANNKQAPGTYDRSRTWQDVALELGKLILWGLALYFLDIDLPG